MQYLISRRLLAAVALVGIGLSMHGHALPTTITKVADTNTIIPGRAATFTSFSLTASSTGEDVAFIGFGPQQYSCVCARIDGTLSVLADRATAVPETTFSFDRFGEVAIDGDVVAFVGFGGIPQYSPNSGSTGIYVSDGGPLRVAVDNFFIFSPPDGGDDNTVMPGGNILSNPFPPVQNVFRLVNNVTLRGDTVTFTGVGYEGQSGVYTSTNGELRLIIDTNSMVPAGTGNFQAFIIDPFDPVSSRPSPGGDTVAFVARGTGDDLGIYATDGTATTAVVDTSTLLPGGSEPFSSLSRPWLDTGAATFVGADASGNAGVYAVTIGGAPRVVADRSTRVPGTSSNFADVGCASLEGQKVLFSTVSQGNFYVEDAGFLGKIVAVGDTLDNKVVQALECDDGLRGNTFSFVARFTDGSSGVFLVRLDATLRLVEGANLIKLSIRPDGVSTSRDLLEYLGPEALSVTQLDPASGTARTTTRSGNGFQGADFQIDYLAGVLVSMASGKQVALTGSLLTAESTLVPGVNLYAPLSIAPGLDAHGLLLDLAGGVDVSSISRLNPRTGRFDTAVRTAGGARGANFPIVELEAYLVSVR